MEIFSNIWNVLTSENEFVTKLFTIPTVPIEAYLVFLLLKKLSNMKIEKIQSTFYISILSLITLLTKFIIPSPYNVFFNYLLMYIEIKIIFKTNIIKTLLYTILPTIIFALISTILLQPTLRILDITTRELKLIPIYQLTYLFYLS